MFDYFFVASCSACGIVRCLTHFIVRNFFVQSQVVTRKSQVMHNQLATYSIIHVDPLRFFHAIVKAILHTSRWRTDASFVSMTSWRISISWE